jgi:hypothetical protein
MMYDVFSDTYIQFQWLVKAKRVYAVKIYHAMLQCTIIQSIQIIEVKVLKLFK